MKGKSMETVFILVLMLVMTTNANSQQLIGRTGSASGQNWQSSWIDLNEAINFRRGDVLRITVIGSAENIVVRLLPSGIHPSSSDGILGGVRSMPTDGVLQLELPEDRSNVVQISVHGGQTACHLLLGSRNGPVTLVSVERTTR